MRNFEAVTAKQIAERAGVSPETIWAWKARHKDFPVPVDPTPPFYIWAWREVESWLVATRRYDKATRQPIRRSR